MVRCFIITLFSFGLMACTVEDKIDRQSSAQQNSQTQESPFPAAVPFYNRTGSIVNMRSGPGTEFVRINIMHPNEGGNVTGCGNSKTWCYITKLDHQYGGWVKMDLLSREAP